MYDPERTGGFLAWWLSQPHFGLSVRVKPTLPKVGSWSPPGLPKTQSSIAGVKSPCIWAFLVSLERSWGVDVQNVCMRQATGTLTHLMARPQVPCVTQKGSKELDLRKWSETWCRSLPPRRSKISLFFGVLHPSSPSSKPLSPSWTAIRFSIDKWIKNSSNFPIAWSSSLLIGAFYLHYFEVGFFFMFLVVGLSEKGRGTWLAPASITEMFVFVIFLWLLLSISWFLLTSLMVKMVLLGSMESKPLATLSLQIGSSLTRVLPSQINALETIQARAKWPN